MVLTTPHRVQSGVMRAGWWHKTTSIMAAVIRTVTDMYVGSRFACSVYSTPARTSSQIYRILWSLPQYYIKHCLPGKSWRGKCGRILHGKEFPGLITHSIIPETSDLGKPYDDSQRAQLKSQEAKMNTSHWDIGSMMKHLSQICNQHIMQSLHDQKYKSLNQE